MIDWMTSHWIVTIVSFTIIYFSFFGMMGERSYRIRYNKRFCKNCHNKHDDRKSYFCGSCGIKRGMSV